MQKICSLLMLTFAMVVGSGCSTMLNVTSWQPGDVIVGSADHIVVTDAQGRRSARETVAILIGKQVSSAGYFTVEDLSSSGLQINVSGREATLENFEGTLKGNELFVRADVLEWTANTDLEEYQDRVTTGSGTNKKTRNVTKTRRVMTGRVLLQITVADGKGRAVLAEREYEGTVNVDPDSGRDAAIEQAAERAVSMFLRDITPVQVTSKVRIDSGDKGQEAIIKTAEQGGVAIAAEDMLNYIRSNPNNAAAHYNLAVFYDAMGKYPEALDMYDQATRLGGEEWYADARAACAKRLTASQALLDESTR